MSDLEAIAFLTAALIISLFISFCIVYATVWALWHLAKWVRSLVDEDYVFYYEGIGSTLDRQDFGP